MAASRKILVFQLQEGIPVCLADVMCLLRQRQYRQLVSKWSSDMTIAPVAVTVFRRTCQARQGRLA